MEYVETVKEENNKPDTKTTIETKKKVTNNHEDVNGDSYKRISFFKDYLAKEKNDIVIGGYTPSVEDSKKLQACLRQKCCVAHPNVALLDSGIATVPLCVGFTGVENVVWPYDVYPQVGLLHVMTLLKFGLSICQFRCDFRVLSFLGKNI